MLSPIKPRPQKHSPHWHKLVEPLRQVMSDGSPPNSRRNVRGRANPIQVLSYHHGDTRVNNPEVGIVHAVTDLDGDKLTWAYDPHLDPVLNFDSAQAGIETLIDEELASDDPGRMKEALMVTRGC